MKAADIPDELMLTAVRNSTQPWGTAHRNDVETEVSRLLHRDVPWKVTLAKARTLIRQKRMDGCPCSCRGDWSVIERGDEE